MWKKTKFIWSLLFRLGFKKGAKEGLIRGYEKGNISFVNLKSSYYKDTYQYSIRVLKYAIKVNGMSFDKYNPPSKRQYHKKLLRAVYFRISTRSVELYRSIIVLCENGWASTAPILLRSLFECFIICVVIAKKDSEYMAFKYFIHDYLSDLHEYSDGGTGGDEHNKKQIQEMREQLSKSDKEKANKYIERFLGKKRPQNNWYKPEYEGVGAIIEECCTETTKVGMKDMWNILSKATHVSHIGSNIFKSKPDKYEINPREDRGGVLMALGGATMLLLEISSLRCMMEGLGALEEGGKLRLEREDIKKKYFS